MRLMVSTTKTWVLAVVLLAFIAVMACGTPDATKPDLNQQRQASLEAREEAFAKASALYPIPATENFPARQALVQYTIDTDRVGVQWYVYVMGDNANIIGYYVARNKPINSCNFLSSSEQIHGDSYGKSILTAPSLDGVFYGGGGSSAQCSAFFFYDWETGALIEVGGLKYFTANQPLALDVEPIRVQ